MFSSPMSIVKDTIPTPVSQLLLWEQLKGDAVYLRTPKHSGYKEFTWSTVASQARRVAQMLKEKGLEPNSKIGLFAKNCPEWFIVDLGIMMAGHISVPIYSAANRNTLTYIIDHAEIPLLFVGQADDVSLNRVSISSECEVVALPDCIMDGDRSWLSYIACDEIAVPVEQSLDDVMTIIYTSGSTGNPKGVVHTYRSFATAVSAVQKELMLTTSDRLFSYLPLAHVVERLFIEMASIYSGCQVWFTEEISTFNRDICACRPTFFVSVPRLWTKFQQMVQSQFEERKLKRLLTVPLIRNWVAYSIRKKLGLNKARHFASGSAPLPVPVAKWFGQIGINISEGWGMTENCGLGTGNFPFNGSKLGSIGQPLGDVSLRISEEGELQSQSECNMQEYYKDKLNTREVFTQDGYLKTGDLGNIDSDGYATITGRVKDIFKTTKGKYVAPAPIEVKLSANKYIEFACVIGAGFPQPVAVITLALDEVEASVLIDALSDLRTAVNLELEAHEKLEGIVISNEVWNSDNEMLTPTLKVRRHKVESIYSGLIDFEILKKDKVTSV